MRKQIKIKRNQNRYFLDKSHRKALDLVYYFLDEMGTRSQWVIETLENPNYRGVGFEQLNIEKEGQNRIVLSLCDYYDGRLHFSIQQIIQLIEDWKKVVEQKPEYIYIYREMMGNFVIATTCEDKDSLVFKRDKVGYTLEKFGFGPINHLLKFFIGHDSNDIEVVLFFMQNSNDQCISLGDLYFYKQNQDFGFLTNTYDEDPFKDEIVCSFSQLKQLIEDWKRAVEQKPNYIYVSQEENGDFTVVTCDANA